MKIRWKSLEFFRRFTNPDNDIHFLWKKFRNFLKEQVLLGRSVKVNLNFTPLQAAFYESYVVKRGVNKLKIYFIIKKKKKKVGKLL